MINVDVDCSRESEEQVLCVKLKLAFVFKQHE